MSIIKSIIPKKRKLPYCSMVVLAAGSSNRMGYDKITASLCGIPVIIRTLSVFEQTECVTEIIVVTRKDSITELTNLIEQHGIKKVTKIVEGGKSRVESSSIGVFHCSNNSKLIGIHDGARPLISSDLVLKCAKAAKHNLACCPGITPTDTIKQINSKSETVATLPRETMVAVQTPQIFDASLIKGALTKAVNEHWSITDDASAVEKLGVSVFIEKGSSENIKLTTPIDFYIAEKILQERGCQK